MRPLHFGIGQRPLGRAERETKREADAPVRARLCLDSDRTRAPRRACRARPNGSCHEPSRRARCHRRQSRCRARSRDSAAAASTVSGVPDCAAAERVEIELGDVDVFVRGNAGRRHDGRRQHAERADDAAARQIAAARPRTRYGGTCDARRTSARPAALRRRARRGPSRRRNRRCGGRRSSASRWRRRSTRPPRGALRLRASRVAPSSNRRRRRARGAGCARPTRAAPAAATAAAPRTARTAGCRSARSRRRSAKCAASAGVDERKRERLRAAGGQQHAPHEPIALDARIRTAAPAPSARETSSAAGRSRSGAPISSMRSTSREHVHAERRDRSRPSRRLVRAADA